MSELKKLPRHVAIIMDGNGRWAKAHALAVAQGHFTLFPRRTGSAAPPR